MKRILITGASGFIGQRMLELKADHYQLQQASLRATPIAELDLKGIDSVVHLAGLAHQLGDVDAREYYRINTDMSLELARAAKAYGVPHFIYVSSTKVYGDGRIGEVYTEKSPCEPTDDYGKSKLLAEEGLKEMEDAHFTVSILRPPLVYGPGVKGNLLRFMKLARSGVPLPFGAIRNNRAMVFVDNLLDLMDLLIAQRPSGIFTLCESTEVSTSLLFREIQKHLRSGSLLFSVPRICWLPLRWLRPALYHRLIGSFNLDDHWTRERTGYREQHSFAEGIEAMVYHFKQQL